VAEHFGWLSVRVLLPPPLTTTIITLPVAVIVGGVGPGPLEPAAVPRAELVGGGTLAGVVARSVAEVAGVVGAAEVSVAGDADPDAELGGAVDGGVLSGAVSPECLEPVHAQASASVRTPNEPRVTALPITAAIVPDRTGIYAR
jgi:hypothetical protein